MQTDRRKPPAAAAAPRTSAAPARVTAPEPSISEMRRQQILDAAERCFCEHGFHGASMAEIAHTFGMSAGHIYNYFDSKEAIIAAIVERDLAQFFRRVEQLRGARNLREAIVERIEANVADRLARGKSALQLEVLAEAGRNPRIAEMVQSVDARVRSVLRQLLSDGLPEGGALRDLDGKVDVLMALGDGLMVRGLRHPGISRPQVTRVLRATVRQLLDG